MPLRLLSWNIRHLDAAWRDLAKRDEIDVALLQEAKRPPAEVASETIPDRASPWHTTGHQGTSFRTAIAHLSNRVTVRPIPTGAIGDPDGAVLQVSREGTLTAAEVTAGDKTFVLVSAYAFWEQPLSREGSAWIYADASAHRLISDLSRLVGSQRGHKIIVAGDFNLLHGYGEEGSAYWKRRYDTVFERLDAIGLTFVGPQAPNGRQAAPWPSELPAESRNVPTFRSSRQTSETASRQLDFVFASTAISSRVTARALNSVEAWGPSDHCPIEIEVG